MTDTPEIAEFKAKVRKEQSAKRKAVAKNLSNEVFDIIADKIISVINGINMDGAVVSGFLPIGSEVDVRPTLALALQSNFEICLPCVVEKDNPLVFRKWREGDNLIAEDFGTKAPHPNAEELLPNVIITPLLAFDERGYRLGYGGGFYDRTIAKFNEMNHEFITIGVALDMQKIDEVPIGTYDEPLNYVITEKQIYKN